MSITLAKMKLLLILAKASWKIAKTFPVVCYFTWKLELVSDILWLIVGIFLWILWRFWYHLFGRTSVNDCFWNISCHLCSIQSSYVIMLCYFIMILPYSTQNYMETTLDWLTGSYYMVGKNWNVKKSIK